ncbi:MAG: hypothetical protein ABL977_02640 [Candidatus Eisenbacteria bacterium]
MDSITTLDTPAREANETVAASSRKRGRPLEMSAEKVLMLIRDKHSAGSLFRVHREQPALYARARRLFGTWAQALKMAGLDHTQALAEARRRSLETRRRARTSPRG